VVVADHCIYFGVMLILQKLDAEVMVLYSANRTETLTGSLLAVVTMFPTRANGV